MRELVHDFLYLQFACPESEMCIWMRYGYSTHSMRNMPPVWGVMIDTGTGKTKITIEEFADWVGKVTISGPLIYAVPAHKLSAEIEQQFSDWGINARVFRGREWVDLDNPKERMCLNLEAVELASRLHADISRSCCKSGKQECVFYKSCRYQAQIVDPEGVQVWIVASDLLFHGHRAFGKPVAVIIDEAVWDKGLRGLGPNPEAFSIERNLCHRDVVKDTANPAAMHVYYRNELARALQQQKTDGGIEQQFLAAVFDAKACDEAIGLEWKLLPKVELRPGMSKAEIKKLSLDTITQDKIRVGRLLIKVFAEIRYLLKHPEIKISGRLLLSHEQRVLQWRGIAEIKDIFKVPTMLLDATLPALDILQVYHPQADIVAKIKVAIPPAVRIKQVVNAPTSSKKLDDEKHLAELHRYILQRWYETGRNETLVVVQKKVEAYLKTRLPSNVTAAHFNAIAGLDAFKNARLVILAGRTAPGPDAVETLAATLSGVQPQIITAKKPGDFVWYRRVRRPIRLRDGRGIKIAADEHPDRFVESVRWLTHEAELIQAIGRARAVNRTDETPVDIDLLFDTSVVTVDEVMPWELPSLLLATAATGVMLTSQMDMVKLWPELWPNEKAAFRTLKQGVPTLPGFVEVPYQLTGPKMKSRLAYFDPSVIPDPVSWLRNKLGRLVPK